MVCHIMVIFNGDVYYTGDYYGQGKVREKEFHKSCATLGIKKEHAILINDPYVDGQSHTLFSSSALIVLLPLIISFYFLCFFVVALLTFMQTCSCRY